VNKLTENQPAPHSAFQRRLAIPGDLLDDSGKYKAGPGTYYINKDIFAARLGLAMERNGTVGIVPLSGVFVPRPGDLCIGIITEVGPSNWMTDINAPYPAPMHASETPWKIEFGETAEYLKPGDAILCKVLFVDESKKTQVTMKESNLRKLQGGQIVDVSPAKVARIIGKNGSMVALIKKYTDAWMFVGQNGRIWVNGDMPMIQVVIDAIRIIEAESHQSGLTERIDAFLKERVGTPKVPTTQNVEAEAR
jgi:exosome complex component RRP4